jgi:hypothetical protein
MKQICKRCFSECVEYKCSNDKCPNHVEPIRDDTAQLEDVEQIRKVRFSMRLIFELFADGQMFRFRVDRGLPEGCEIVRINRDPWPREQEMIELLVKAAFHDGGKDGDLFDILVTNVYD